MRQHLAPSRPFREADAGPSAGLPNRLTPGSRACLLGDNHRRWIDGTTCEWFGSVRFGSVLASWRAYSGSLMVVALRLAACGGSPGGGDADTGSTGSTEGGTSGAESSACVAIEAAQVDCVQINAEAYLADPIPGCDDGAVEPSSPPDGADAQLDWIVGRWPGLVSETDPALVGVWTPLISNEVPGPETPDQHLPVHSIHRPTGKFLQFGSHDDGTEGNQFTTDKVVWYPPEPCMTPFENGIRSCDTTFDRIPGTVDIEAHAHVNQEGGDPDMTEFNLFCSGHVNMPPVDAAELLDPQTLTVGGSAPENVNQSYPGAFMFGELLPDEGIEQFGDYTWRRLDNLSNYRWYPTATVMANGNIAVPGGVFNAGGSLACRETAEGMPKNDLECTCDPEDPEDFYTGLGICGMDGLCLPPDRTTNAGMALAMALDVDPGFQPCLFVTNLVNGADIGTRTDEFEITWTASDVGTFFGSYPQMFVLPDLDVFSTAGTNLGGKLINVGSESSFNPGNGAMLWDPFAPENGVVEEIGGPSCTKGSSAVMFASDRILKFGGTSGPDNRQTSALSEILDFSQPCPEWRRVEGGELGMPRHFSAGVLLPDGNVIATGGGLGGGHVGDQDDPATDGFTERSYAVFTTERFDRNTETWCRLADLPGTEGDDLPTYRGYHSQSFLLPDGRIYLGAGGARNGTTSHYDYQLYAPPYLFRGPRPLLAPDEGETVVEGITEMITGGSVVRFARESEVEIDRVTLVKLSAATHQFDQEQRFVELDIDDVDTDWIDVVPPPSTCYATPGYYMLFAISDLGVPSIGQYVAIRGTCETADEQAVIPVYPSPSPVAVNDLRAAGTSGLHASCGGEGSTLGLEEFERSLLELCTGTRGCPENGTVAIEARFVSTTGAASVSVNDLLDSAVLTFADGVPSFVADALALDVAGTEFNIDVDLGPGDHVIQICASLGLLSACIEQPLRIDPVLVGGDADEYRAGRIERAELAVDELVPGSGLDLGDDDVVEVGLPSGFVFPFFGDEIDTLWIGANGAIRTTSGAVAATNASLPSVNGPEIAVYWDDLDPSEGGRVSTYYDGTRFVVAWDRVPNAAGGVVSAQAHLYADGRIELHYPSVSSGTSGYGVSATIGIQHDIDALALSTNSDEFLLGIDAVAFDTSSCVASALRLPDSTPCSDRVVALPMTVDICGGHQDVSFTTPGVPTICAPHSNAVVMGSLWLGEDRQAVADDGTSRLFVGDYEARWSIREPRETPLSAASFSEVGERTDQPIRVRFSDDEQVCCREDQMLEVLTSGNDGPIYVGTYAATCAIGLAGNDTLNSGDGDDTLLGREDDDVIYAGAGEDIVVGGLGVDIMYGGEGDDVLIGLDGDDIGVGEDGDDEMWGGAGDDYLCDFLYTGNETIIPGPGVDEVLPGPGDDHVVILDLCEVEDGEILDGGDDDDTLWLPAGVVVLDLENLGAIVENFEHVETITGGQWGTAECALAP